jgi:hypothetical protein
MTHLAALAGLAIALAAGAVVGASSRDRGDPSWPEPGIRVTPMLQPCVDVMLERSRTFRSLYRAIGRRTDLRVVITLDERSPSAKGGRRAETTITRTGSLRDARVVLFDADHPVELIAHELEHVREQAEGMNLPLLASAHWPGIFRLFDGTFETSRAQDTGVSVADEVGGHGRLCLSMSYARLTAHPQ